MKILVPIDFSPASQSALHYAIALGRQLPAELVLFHAFYLPVGGDVTFFVDAQLLRQEERRAQTRLNELIGTVPDIQRVKHRPVIKMTGAPEGIDHAVKAEGVDLVVMGSHGTHDPAVAWLGSTTYHVMKHAPCPVLAVPPYTAAFRPRHVAFGTDLQATEENASLDLLKRLLRQWKATLHIIHVHPQPETIGVAPAEEALHLDRIFHELPHQYHFPEAKDAVEGIRQYVEKHPIDLLVLLPRRRPLLQGMFQKSVTKVLTSHVAVPLLTLSNDD